MKNVLERLLASLAMITTVYYINFLMLNIELLSIKNIQAVIKEPYKFMNVSQCLLTKVCSLVVSNLRPETTGSNPVIGCVQMRALCCNSPAHA